MNTTLYGVWSQGLFAQSDHHSQWYGYRKSNLVQIARLVVLHIDYRKSVGLTTNIEEADGNEHGCESQLNGRNNCMEPKERDLRQALGTQEDIHFLNTSIDGHDKR